MFLPQTLSDLPANAMSAGIAVGQRAWRWQAGGRRERSLAQTEIYQLVAYREHERQGRPQTLNGAKRLTLLKSILTVYSNWRKRVYYLSGRGSVW